MTSFQEQRVLAAISEDKVVTYIRQNFVLKKYKNKCLETLEKRDAVIFDNYIRIMEQKTDFGKKIRLLLKKINSEYTKRDMYSYKNCDHIINYLCKIKKLARAGKYDKCDIDFELCSIYLFHYLQYNVFYEENN